jgi:hypothetical protein
MLGFDYEVMKTGDPKYDLEKGPEYGCYVYGCFIEGCRFDEETMTL